MTWLAFVLGAVLSWGSYGVLLHQGQVKLGNPLRALLCVGVAYFLIGVLVPIAALSYQATGLRGFTSAGTTAATIAPPISRTRRTTSRTGQGVVPNICGGAGTAAGSGK